MIVTQPLGPLDQPEELVHPRDKGFWDGSAFIFDPPLERPGINAQGEPVTHTIARLSFAENMMLGDGITRNDILYALLNSIKIEETDHNPMEGDHEDE